VVVAFRIKDDELTAFMPRLREDAATDAIDGDDLSASAARPLIGRW
jgi:hypothetical protein